MEQNSRKKQLDLVLVDLGLHEQLNVQAAFLQLEEDVRRLPCKKRCHIAEELLRPQVECLVRLRRARLEDDWQERDSGGLPTTGPHDQLQVGAMLAGESSREDGGVHARPRGIRAQEADLEPEVSHPRRLVQRCT
jgi:hypothetical protein